MIGLQMTAAVASLLASILAIVSAWRRVSRRRRASDDEFVFTLNSSIKKVYVPKAVKLEALVRMGRPNAVTEEEWRAVLAAVAAREQLALSAREQRKSQMPDWALLLLRTDDADRYRKEFGAHLCELIQAGEMRQARRDRRRMIAAVLWFAVALRARRLITQTQSR